MSGTEWLVVLGGVAAIGWVNWYFFAGRRVGNSSGGPQGREKGEE